VAKKRTQAEVGRELQKLARKLENGQVPENYDALLDELLGTGMTERDPELDAEAMRRLRQSS